MIFTANQVPRHQSSSHDFDAFGAKDCAPSQISTVRIFAITADGPSSKRAIQNRSFFHQHVARAATMTNVIFNNAFQRDFKSPEVLFHIPEAVTDSKSKTSETNEGALKQHGFKKISFGRRTLFEGPPNLLAVQALINAGFEPFSHTPTDRVSLGGVGAAVVMRRLLYFAIIATQTPIEDEDGSTTTWVRDQRLQLGLNDCDLGQGHFFPYFDGLLLPDSGAINDFIDLFHINLGKDHDQRLSAISSLAKGWKSIASTTAGRIITHMLFCIRMALSAGGLTRCVLSRTGEYSGFIIYTDSSFYKMGKVITPIAGAALQQEVLTISGHAATIDEMAVILARGVLRPDGNPRPIDPESITTARYLHYVIADRIFSDEDQAKIRALIPRLRFRQQFFRALDAENLVQVLATIQRKGRLDINAPFDYSSGDIFTTKDILSTMLAYGPVAPSPQDKKNSNVILTINGNYKRGTTAGTLSGIPIFAKPTQEAFEDWKALRRDGTISFMIKGKSASGEMRIRKLGMIVHVDDVVGKQIEKSYIAIGKRGTKRRARFMDEGDEDHTGGKSEKTVTKEASERASKRSRATTENTELLGFLGMVQEDVDMD